MSTTRAVGRSAKAAGRRVRIRRRVLVAVGLTPGAGIEMVAIELPRRRDCQIQRRPARQAQGRAVVPQLASRMALTTFSTKVSADMLGVFQNCVTASCMAPEKFGVLRSSIASTWFAG